MIKTSLLFVYGNRSSPQALEQYAKVQKIVHSFHPEIKIEFLNPKSDWKTLKNCPKDTILLPLLVIRGTEYRHLLGQIKLFNLDINVLPPFSETRAFSKLLKDNPKDTCYFLHGHPIESEQKIYTLLKSSIEKKAPSSSVFYVDQDPKIKPFLQTRNDSSQKIFISPLFFLRGKHIKEDLINSNLKMMNNVEWEVGPTILENDKILNLFLQSQNLIS